MAKSKNHTNHNQGESYDCSLIRVFLKDRIYVLLCTCRSQGTPKWHQEAKISSLSITQGGTCCGLLQCHYYDVTLWLQVDPKFLRNLRFAKKHNKKGSQKMDTS